jgi:hypothetical protein
MAGGGDELIQHKRPLAMRGGLIARGDLAEQLTLGGETHR